MWNPAGMGDLEDLIERHFRVLEASAPAPGFGRYLRPVMLGSAHLVLAAAVREAYDQGRLDAAMAVRAMGKGRNA
jgi:hypothetical protein